MAQINQRLSDVGFHLINGHVAWVLIHHSLLADKFGMKPSEVSARFKSDAHWKPEMIIKSMRREAWAS